MAPNPITASSHRGRAGDVVRGDLLAGGEPRPGQSRQQLVAFAFDSTSLVASAVIFVFALLILYHVVLPLTRFHSGYPYSIGTRRRYQREKHYYKVEIPNPDGLSIQTPDDDDDDDDNKVNNDSSSFSSFQNSSSHYPYPYPFSMATQQDSPEHNPLRPRARIPTPHSGPSATISLAQGRYVGVHLPASPLIPRAVEAWRGIPYAETTAGANRFRPPVPLSITDAAGHPSSSSSSSREGVIRADTWGPMCPGSAARVPGMADGEDCLNLNVYRQAGYNPARDGKVPVVVYVHGGAFNGGAGTERDMASFVGWSEAPVVGVNFNYRVGALGFPSSGVAEREGVLNLGLWDQRLLFEWVRENVAEFGGDRDRITLIGLSAGAHSVGYHLQSYTDSCTTAPFHGAIMESGGATARVTLSPTHPRTEGQFNEFLAECGINPDQMPADQIFPKLRSLPLDVILAASTSVFARYQDPIRWPFQPVVERSRAGEEGGLVGDLPINTFHRGNHLRIPVLTGFNTNEGTAFTSPRVDTGDDFLRKFAILIPGMNPSDMQTLSGLYPDPATYPSSPYARVPPGYGRQWARYEAAYAQYAYICPVLQTGHFYSSSSSSSGEGEGEGHNDTPPPVWIYHFAALSRPDLGGKANHVDEAAVVAHDMSAIGAFPGLVRTADAMHGAWTRFIATGDPNPPRSQGRERQRQPQQNGSSSAPASADTPDTPFWPRFKSPFVGDTVGSPGRLRRKAGAGAEGCGEVMMFGLGNDERMGGAGSGAPGRPATVARLSEGELERCRFWWERVDLSEGMGVRPGGGGGGGGASASKARL